MVGTRETSSWACWRRISFATAGSSSPSPADALLIALPPPCDLLQVARFSVKVGDCNQKSLNFLEARPRRRKIDMLPLRRILRGGRREQAGGARMRQGAGVGAERRTPEREVAVIGAGPGGLSAARLLRDAGVHAVV